MQETLIFFLYRALLNSSFAFFVLYLLYRSVRNPAYRRGLGERFGILPASLQRTEFGAVWFHAVSVGEVLSVLPLLSELRAGQPRRPIVISCGTVAGRAAAENNLAHLVDGIFYAPLDLVFIVRRVLRRIRPALLVVCETEIWPNLWREARRSGARVIIVNGRISDQSFPKYRWLRALLRPSFRQADRIFVQSEADAVRYRELGATEEQVMFTGNLKYDFQPSSGKLPQPIGNFLAELPDRRTWIAASTVAPVRPGDVDEDDAVLDAFSAIAESVPNLLLILAPRKPDRFAEVAAKLANRRIPHVSRSELPASAPALPAVLLLDSIGELAAVFSEAQVVFMGGTLADRGGHNVLEPAAYAKPIVVGPHLENFPAIASSFRAGKALLEIQTPSQLPAAILKLFSDPEDFGKRAYGLATAQQGVAKRIASQLEACYDHAVPWRVPFAPATLFLGALACLWRLGSSVHRRFRLSRQVRVNTPVFSVGNLTVGGTGKTPFTLWLAAWLASEAEQPAILTRGYRRKQSERETILRRGETASVETTGDEAQILLRSGLADLGIGANRASLAKRLEAVAKPSIFLLDDGFQYAALAREADIVLIDSLNPFGGGALLPLGRLREPIAALKRANAVIITRAQPGRRYAGIRALVSQSQPAVPVFLARMRPRSWISSTGGKLPAAHFAEKKVAAFCGLGNPSAFWQTLDHLSLKVVSRHAFPDHHRYREAELSAFWRKAQAAGAEAILTTEKDRCNLLNPIPSGIPLHWLEVVLEVDDSEALQSLLRLSLRSSPAAL